MARLNRATAKFVRQELMKLFRTVHLRGLVAAVGQRMQESAVPWKPLGTFINLDRLRAGVELMEAIPSAGRGTPPTKLERYEAELRKWKRRRTIAQTKVAKYARLVRYHRKGVAK